MTRGHARSKGDSDPIFYENQGLEVMGSSNINEQYNSNCPRAVVHLYT